MQKSLLVLFVYFFTCFTNAKSNPIFGLSPSETAEISAMCQNTTFSPENLGSHTQDLMLVKPITPENAFWLGACCGVVGYAAVLVSNDSSNTLEKNVIYGATANAIAVGMILSASTYSLFSTVFRTNGGGATNCCGLFLLL